MPSNFNYSICNRCIMDTTDPEITFDVEGVCNHCLLFDNVTKSHWHPNEDGKVLLEKIVNNIKQEGKDLPYDCILGLSGGVDSSYLVLKAAEWGLRPLIFHVDAGWNSELAVSNIQKVISYCDYHLFTHVVDWEEMRDLQMAYLKSGVANQDVPQDHIFFATTYHYAVKNKIKYVLSGGNIATESVFPNAWHHSAMDASNLLDIHQKFGNINLIDYRTISFLDYYFYYPIVKGFRTIRPLNYMPYSKSMAITELSNKTGWRSYGRKHGESIFTKFFQNYYLPEKFGYDKRRPHYSSLILSGEMSRDAAVELMTEELYDKYELEHDIDYFCKKMMISREQFDELMNIPNQSYNYYRSWDFKYATMKKIQNIVSRITGHNLKVYS